jgi:hypothetical protein
MPTVEVHLTCGCKRSVTAPLSGKGLMLLFLMQVIPTTAYSIYFEFCYWTRGCKNNQVTFHLIERRIS